MSAADVFRITVCLLSIKAQLELVIARYVILRSLQYLGIPEDRTVEK